MATISGAATSPAAVPAAANPSNSVNTATGFPATERWPGPVDPGQYTDAGPVYPIVGPLAGPWILDDFTGSIPADPEGSTGIQDLSWTTGTNGPMVPWDSNAGAPFAPSGPVNPDLHGQDLGATFQAQHVAPAQIGDLRRQTIVAEAWDRHYADGNVPYDPAPAGRVNFDQRQPWDPAPGDGGGWSPWDPGYAERPIYNNTAYQATAVTNAATPYGVSGDLPNRAPFNTYAAAAYEPPPDPAVGNQGAALADNTAGGWLLG